ncbi:hypothetical protein BKC65_02185 [Salmonella enterica subsp. enterica serovar Agona]|nr:hypothetical protein [Salmonella enterica subsp. enterica serovar Agona]
MSKLSYEEIIKRAKINADCGEHLSPEEVTELVLAFEAQVKQLAAERDAVVAEEQEPVAYIIQDAEMRSRGNPGFLSYDGSISNEDINEYEISITPLYTHPVTDSEIASLRAEARKQGAIFAANRMLAAWDAGFVDDTPENAADIARAILSMTEFMDDAPEGDFDRSFADEMLEAIAAQLRSQSEQVKGVQS